jgi:Na+-translocating ferredoxin:NAD+ oxidoreductase RnfD subunit
LGNLATYGKRDVEYGGGISLIIVVIRLFGGLPEGVMYAILFITIFPYLTSTQTKGIEGGKMKTAIHMIDTY